jgi:hypothetical protein
VALGWLGIGVVFAVLSMGGITPVLGWLVDNLPGWSSLRCPTRYAIVTALAVLMLAVEGFRVVAQHWPGNRKVTLGVTTGLIVLNGVDLLRAYAERQGHYSHNPPAVWERAFIEDMVTKSRLPGGRPRRVLAPNWVLRENSGMSYGHSMVTGFANPQLAGPWNAVHRLGALDFNPRDPVNLPLDIFTMPPDTFAELALDYAWEQQRERLHFVAQGDRWLEVDSSDPAAVAKLISYGADRLVLTVDSVAPVTLTLAEPWYPGWRAEAGDKTVEVALAGDWKRQLTVPVGQQEVVLSYTSRWLRPGAALSMLTALVTGLLWWRTRSDVQAE